MWHALHIYIHNFEAIDRFLSEDFEVFLEENAQAFKRFFYMRYWLGGPHIRFRFEPEAEASVPAITAALEQTVRRFLENKSYPLASEKDFYTASMLANEDIDATQIFWSEHGSVVSEPYVPEVARYGGEDDMAPTEAIFCASTELARTVGKLPYPKRLMASVALFHFTMRTFKAQGASISEYAALWASYQSAQLPSEGIGSLCRQVAQKETVPALFRPYLEVLKTHIDTTHPQALGALYSHIHMFNNRIGVFPIYEFWIAKYLSQVVRV